MKARHDAHNFVVSDIYLNDFDVKSSELVRSTQVCSIERLQRVIGRILLAIPERASFIQKAKTSVSWYSRNKTYITARDKDIDVVDMGWSIC
jgi:hypothetical protein